MSGFGGNLAEAIAAYQARSAANGHDVGGGRIIEPTPCTDPTCPDHAKENR
jgi:hypothetical protein